MPWRPQAQRGGSNPVVKRWGRHGRLGRPRDDNVGFLLVSSIIVLAIMTVIVSFYLNAIIEEVKIGRIVNNGPQAYYLAEAGVQEAFWKLQNDQDWKQNFEGQKNWSANFSRVDMLVPGGAYAVSVVNTDKAAATITATGTVAIGSTVVQRVVQTSVFKALSELPTSNLAVFSDDDIKSAGANITIAGGDVFTNNDLLLDLASDWMVAGKASAVGAVTVSESSHLSASAVFDKNRPPLPETIQIPELDFDSTATTSLKSRATQVYKESDFGKLLKDNPVLTVDGITYVTGNVRIKNGGQLTINGALVADGTVSVGSGGKKRGMAALTVNHTIPESGLFVKKNLTIGGFETSFAVAGLVYVGNNLRIQDAEERDVVASTTGAIIAQSINFYTAWNPLTVNFNQTWVSEALGAPFSSPVLLINHWEEEY